MMHDTTSENSILSRKIRMSQIKILFVLLVPFVSFVQPSISVGESLTINFKNLKSIPPDNLIIIDTRSKFKYLLGHIPKKKLLEYYNQSQFHLQLSVFEGFGCSLVESMMCKCIPVGSKVNIIPYIIGDTGVVLDKRNQKELNKIILNLTTSSKNELSVRFSDSRNRAKENFDFEIRKKRLLNAII